MHKHRSLNSHLPLLTSKLNYPQSFLSWPIGLAHILGLSCAVTSIAAVTRQMVAVVLATMVFVTSSGAATGDVLLKNVGQLRGHVITTREVQLHYVLEKVADSRSKTETVQPLKVDAKEVGFLVSQLLREWSVFMETKGISVAEVPQTEVDSVTTILKEVIDRNAFYKALEFNEKELREAVRRKLQARQFVKFKRESAIAPVTDAEAQKYFNENRGRFGEQADFNQFRDSIKGALNRQMIDQRMQEWYTILLRKYEARNQVTDINY
jgi:hypothetical protein